jgi:hypothetical protein
MNTGVEGKPSREFQIRWTDRIYRLHLTGIGNHAPKGPGVFEIVLFPPGAEDGEVLYVGFEPGGGSVSQTLAAAFENRGGLPPEKLRILHENIANAYFDAVSVADAESDQDLMDLAWAVVARKKPRLNEASSQPHSGRFSAITYREL